MSDIFPCRRGDPQYKKYMLMEYGLKSIPALIFLVTSSYRFTELRYVAEHRENLSKSFKAKVVLCVVMAVCYTALIPINYFSSPDLVFSSWVNQCKNENYSWLNLLQAVAWSISAYLVIHEYKRRM